MKLPVHDFFVCLQCGSGDLSVVGGGVHTYRERIDEARMLCDGCRETYPVVNGIPRFVSVNNYAGSFGLQWNRHRTAQLDSHTGLPISRNRLFEVTGWPERMDGETILEAGSGAGRFTEILLGTGAEIFSFDYSSAVEANWLNNGHSPNLHLFQGDIFRIPCRQEAFDRVICLGVLQHTPDPRKAFESLARYVRPGGVLVVDVYSKRLLSLLGWKYLLRPVTKRMEKELLYRIVSHGVPTLIPFAKFLRRVAGRVGARVLPIVEYSHLGLPSELNREWAILDTFDMYSPSHDHPQSLETVNRWFREAGFMDVVVRLGPNGIVGRGFKPARELRRRLHGDPGGREMKRLGAK
jgi:SAM-dependent methyltransferase